MKFRIVKERTGRFVIEQKLKYWPFWFSFGCFSYNTVENAELRIEKHIEWLNRPGRVTVKEIKI